MSSSFRTGASGHGKRVGSNSAMFTVGKEWERHHVTVTLPESRNGYYKLWMNHRRSTVFLDGVQVEEGETPTPFAPADKVEIGMTTGQEAYCNLFYTTEKIPVRVQVCVYDKDVEEATVHYVVYDYRGFEVTSFDRKVALAPAPGERYGEETFDLDVDWKGLMSLMASATVGDVGGSEWEMIFARVRPAHPADETMDQRSPIGTHMVGERCMEVAEKLGIRWQRMLDFFEKDGSLYWDKTEREQGTWTFNDAGIDRYRKHHFNILGLLWRVPKWGMVHPDDLKEGFCRRLPNLDLWKEYVYKTVSHFKDRVHYWELWNEPFSWPWQDTPENYTRLLKATWEAAKSADPDCKIVGGCLAPLDYASTRSFMNRMFGDGGLEHMDVLSIHANQGGMSPAGPMMPEENMGQTAGKTVSQAYREITDLMRAYGPVKPIWNSEHPIWCMPYSRLHPWVDDVPWTRQDPPMDPVQGAQFVVRGVTAEMGANCPRTFFYLFQGKNGRYENGDITQSLLSGHFQLKSSAAVMAELLWQLGWSEFHKQLDWGGVARCYLFATPDGPVAVAWGLRAYAKPGVLHLPAEAASFTYLDLMGNPRSDVTKGKQCTLPLGPEPVYIGANAMETLESVLSAARVTGLMPERAGKALRKAPDLAQSLTYAGETALVEDLVVYVFEKSDGAVALVLNERTDNPTLALPTTAPVTVTELGRTIDVSETKGEYRTVELTQTPLIVDAPGMAPKELLALLKNARIEGLRTFELEGVWLTTIQGKLHLTIRIRNVGTEEISPVVTVKSLPKDLTVQDRAMSMAALSPGKTGQVGFPVVHAGAPEAVSGSATIEVTAGKETTTFKRPLDLAYSLKAERPIVVDGDLSEWGDAGVFALDRKEQVVIGQSTWAGPSDLSAKVRSRWDDAFVYLAVEVSDDFLERRNEAMQLWMGTSVEVFADTNQREDLGKAFYDKDDFQFLFGPATPGAPSDLWGIASKSGKSYLAGLAMTSKKTPGGYVMEIAFPREMFAQTFLPGVLKAEYGPGLSLGLSVVASDRTKEKEGRKSSIVWGGTIRNYLDPSKFGTLVLRP